MSAQDERPLPIVDADGKAHVGQHRPVFADGTRQSWCGYCQRHDREMDAWSASLIDWSPFGPHTAHEIEVSA